MMNFTKFLLIGTLFAAASASAFASPLTTGTLDIDGTMKVVGSGKTSGLDFTSDPVSATGGTGLLAPLDGSNNIAFSNTFTFSNVKPVTGELLFTITKNGFVGEFYVTSYSYNSTSLTFTGYVTGNYGITDNATFVETIDGTGDKGLSYTGELTITPEPNSVLLLGTGLLATCGMISLKRRRTISVAV
jgi:hypothetical protein